MTVDTATTMLCSYTEVTPFQFAQAKKSTLDAVDLSKKGSVDEPILELVQYINVLHQYFTTSSCSGRTIIVADDPMSLIKKKGCKWLYVTHGEANLSQALDSLKEEPLPEAATLKFEPFIMHIQCLNLESARQMLQVAVASGYRNSGMSLGKSGKIILAVRSTAGLEVPLIAQHKLLVNKQYIEFILDKANQKMQANHLQVLRLHKTLEETINMKNISSVKPVAQDITGKKLVTLVTESSHHSNTEVDQESLVWTADLNDEQMFSQMFDPL